MSNSNNWKPIQSRDDIEQLLPHRAPFIFLDSVSSYTGKQLTAHSYIDPSLDVFRGHFPDNPIMPGVLLIEMIAQAGALLIALRQDLQQGEVMALSSVEAAKFRQPVFPRDQLNITVDILNMRSGFYKFSGQAYKDSALIIDLKFAAAKIFL